MQATLAERDTEASYNVFLHFQITLGEGDLVRR